MHSAYVSERKAIIRMKKALAILVCALLVLSSLTPAFARGNSSKEAVGMSIMGFSTIDLYGNTVTSDILNNAVCTVINEWATWCGPCVNEMPHFQKVHEYYSETPQADAQILGCVYVSSTCTPQSALEFLESNGFTWTNLLEDNILETAFFTTNSIPSTMIVDRHGIVREHHVGAFPSESQLKSFIDGWVEILAAEEPEFTPGDVDVDGSITVTDALMILRRAMGILQLPSDDPADYDGNGTVDVTDALTVLRIAMSII